MRYVKIFLLNFQKVFEHRSRSFVWFLISCTGPGLFLLFWIGKLKATDKPIDNWELSSITSYYFLLIVLSSFLMSHTEDEIAQKDIVQGNLVNYLTKPFSYFWMKFFQEVPYRILQGFYGLILCFILLFMFKNIFVLTNSLEIFSLSVLIIFLAHMLAYIFKLIIGLISLWLIDVGGLFQLVEAVLFIFAGYIVPIELLPGILSPIAQILPFSYMIYYPVIAFQGKLSFLESFHIIIIQCIWIGILTVIYQFVWKHGIKKFVGVGQ